MQQMEALQESEEFWPSCHQTVGEDLEDRGGMKTSPCLEQQEKFLLASSTFADALTE